MSKSMNVDRRQFLKGLGVAATVLAAPGMALADAVAAEPAAPAPAGDMPRRKFGRSGVEVPILGIGGMFDIPNNQIVLHQAIAMGVTYWDTANGYGGGKSETGIGTFFERNPETRAKIFLVTKGGSSNPAELTKKLALSLERMKTDYIDLYFVHGISDTTGLNDDMRRWAEEQKAAGKIKLFGFSTHSNMEDCLLKAAPLGWIDGIMVKYDFRLMQKDAMRKAVDACAEAGIGLIAIKTQAGRVEKEEAGTEASLVRGFLEKGFTDKQANLKVVWADARIATICSQMPNITILRDNVAAALDRTALAAEDLELLRAYAEATRSSYCAGCTQLCEGACGGMPIGDVMRALMYHREYGDHTLARSTWHALPAPARMALAAADLAGAEGVCPQRLPIARLVREAGALFA